MLHHHLPRRARPRVAIASLALVLIVTGCGGDTAGRSTATAPVDQQPTATTDASTPTQPVLMGEATPTVVPPGTHPADAAPLPTADDGAQALANLEQAMTRPGYVFHATLTQVNTGAINDPDLVTPVWSAEVWTDLERARSRADYQLDPTYVDPMPFAQPGAIPPAPSTVYADGQVYRTYDGPVWVGVSDPCLGMDKPQVAVAFICDLSSHPWFGGGAFGPNQDAGELYLEHGAEFEGQPAVALSIGEYAMAHLYLDPGTYLPLGWSANLMESGTRVTTIAVDFIPTGAVAADLLDPASIGYVTEPAPVGRILVRRDIITADMSAPEVFVVNADGSGEINLSDNPGSDLGARWSPDGQRIAFGSERDGNHDIYVINADGSELSNLTNSPTGEGEPVWSPDGTQILFSSDRDGTNFSELYVMDTDGTNVIRLSPPDIAGNAMWSAWSPDGRRVAYLSEAGVHVVNADGTGAAQITTTGHGSHLNWTPDGSRLIFAAYSGGNSDIYAVNSDGSGLTNLTDHPADDRWPLISPDGQRILFNSDRDNPGYSRDGYLMTVDGSLPTPLTHPPSTSTCETGCSWSPDGEYILATLLDRTMMSPELAIIRADGTLVTVLTGVTGFSPQWSPVSSTTSP